MSRHPAPTGRAGLARHDAVGVAALVLLLLSASPGAAQATGDAGLATALADARVQAALRSLQGDDGRAAELLAKIGGIISPSGTEHERAEAVGAEMRAIGLQSVRVDDMPNAVGIIPGRSGRALVFVSTLDDLTTVAAFQRAAGPPRVTAERVVGPGTNTSATTVAMLAAARALVQAGFEPEHDLVFAAVAQEETGLKGMRRLYDEWRDRAVAFVDILGDGRGITYGALGIHWWRVRASGPGGHTLQGGLPNVNQAIGRAVDRILQLERPHAHPELRTVLNISILSSGEVFNHKPETGWFSLDVRSLDSGEIAGIEDEVRSVLTRVEAELGMGFEMEEVTRIPGGQIPGMESSGLVLTAVAIARSMGLEPRLSNSGSANLNVAIAGGTPAIGLGGERGGQRGYADEWADRAALMRSARHVLLLAAVLGNAP